MELPLDCLGSRTRGYSGQKLIHYLVRLQTGDEFVNPE